MIIEIAMIVSRPLAEIGSAVGGWSSFGNSSRACAVLERTLWSQTDGYVRGANGVSRSSQGTFIDMRGLRQLHSEISRVFIEAGRTVINLNTAGGGIVSPCIGLGKGVD